MGRCGGHVAALVCLAAAGCGGRAERHAETPDANVEVPVYLMRPERPTGEPTSFVEGRWVATGGMLDQQLLPKMTCLAGSRRGAPGWLFLELADSVDLSALGVTGVFFTAYAGAPHSSSVTFGVMEADGNATCTSRQWGDSTLGFSEMTDECSPSDRTPDPGLIRNLSWSADATAGIAGGYSFCVDVRLIDDSYLL